MFAATELLAARWQMALSLGFHIVLSCFGVAFPAMIYVLHRRGLKDGDADALALAKKWAKVSAVLFAVGAVTGTILSFEMGLLWPGLMSQFGDVIGLPFALEGIAFFIEAVFLGIYLYGWNRLPPRVHLRTLIPMMVAGMFGTFCIVSVNAWMNAPSGFSIDETTGKVTEVEPLAAMFNSAVWGQFVHMFVAAYVVAGFVTAAVYAVGMLRGRHDRQHRLGITVAMVFASVAALLQPFVGHLIGQRLAEQQPSKLAAIEMAEETETRAPLIVGGVYVDGEVRFGIPVPLLGSLAATNSLDGEVPGLDEIPDDLEPPVTVVHLAFQTMVGAGLAMVGIAGWFWWRHRRSDDPYRSRWLLRAVVAGGGLSIVALQAGWTTTEVGRQPWIVYEVMLVEDAVTSNSGIWLTLIALVAVYTSLALLATRIIRGMTRRWRETDDVDLPTPYGPTRADTRSHDSAGTG